MPEDWCPFCPGSGRVPDSYEVFLYPNDFPAFCFDNPSFTAGGDLFKASGARGTCDVVLYSEDHNLLPSRLSAEQWEKVIELWTRRTAELYAQRDVEYVAVFENTGLAIGVTMPHPHGQIYALPFIPPLVQTELDSAKEYSDTNGECLYCRLRAAEMVDGRRVVASNEEFVAFLPFYGRFPGEMQICPRRHFGSLVELSNQERRGLAAILSIARQKFDHLWGAPMPLMMLLRQRPAKGSHLYFHFHIDILPIQRGPAKLKYLASMESGTGTFLNDTRPEDQAALLRAKEPVLPIKSGT